MPQPTGQIAPREIALPVFADYFQFYVQDEIANEDFGALWSEEAVDRLLAVGQFSVGIGTVRNADVPVSVSIHEHAPPEDFGEWEMVNECSILCRSGRIVIAGCTDYLPEAQRMSLKPGSYRVRVCYAGLDHVSADGMEGDDFYRVQIWPQEPGPLRVVKAKTAAGS